MKITLLVLLCLFTPIFAALEVTTILLAGHWRHADQIQSCDYFFRDDGTFTGNVARSGKIIWEFAGKWSSDGKILNYEYTRSSAENVPPGTIDHDKLVEAT